MAHCLFRRREEGALLVWEAEDAEDWRLALTTCMVGGWEGFPFGGVATGAGGKCTL